MQIGISATFQFFKVFSKKLEASTVCKLSISKSHSLIYAEMRDLDIVELLDESFDLELDGVFLKVSSAGFFTFSATGGGSPETTLRSAFPQSPVPASVAAVTRPVTGTTSFWLTVALTDPDADGGLFYSIADIGISKASSISLSATFAKDTKAATAIRNALYTARLDGSVSLFDIFTFRDIAVTYSIVEGKKLSVSGSLDVSLFGSHFTFTGDIQSDSARKVVTADIAAVGNVDLASLFDGGFPNISFTGLRFNLHYPYGRNKSAAKFMMRGNCDFASLQFTGLLYLEGTKPTLASVVFTRSASISTLFDQCIENASWPSDLVDLTLLAGSQVYYNATRDPLTLTLSHDGTAPTLLPAPAGAAGPLPGGPRSVTYREGFNVAASFVLTLLKDIEIAGTLLVNDEGVTARIEIAKPIDIYVLSITRQGDRSLGPVLSLNTKGRTGSLGFAGSLLFFQESFGVAATVAATKSAAGRLKIEAILSPSRDYLPLLHASDRLSFSYSADQGFKVDHWPVFEAVEDIIDFFSTLKELSSAKGGNGICGKIVDIITDKLLGQTWSLSPTFASDSTRGLSLNLSISYSLACDGNAFATVTLKDALVIPIPNSVSLDSSSPHYLWTVIGKAIEGAAESIVQALLNDTESIAKFLALFAGKEAAEYAATLICQKLVDAALDAAVDAALAALADAAATAAGPAAAIAAMGPAIAAALAAAGSQSRPDGDPPAAPGNLAVTVSGGVVTARWMPSSGAQGYTATLSGQDGKPIAASGMLDYRARSHSFDVRPEALPAHCTITVTATGDHGTGPAATTAVTYLAAPAGLVAGPATVSDGGTSLEVTWTGVDGATSYALTAAGLATLHRTGPATAATLTFGPDEPAGTYVVTVVATGGAGTVSSPASAPLTLTRLGIPEGLAATVDDAGTVALRWTAVAGASFYTVTAAGPVMLSRTVTTAETTLAFGPDDPAGDYVVTVAVTGEEGTVAGLPSAPLTLIRLGTPTGLIAAAKTTADVAAPAMIVASWETVANAGSYRLILTAPDGTITAVPVVAAEGDSQSGEVMVPAPAGGAWTLAVQALPPDGESSTVAGTLSTVVPFTGLPAPTGLTIVRSVASDPPDVAAEVRWSAVAQATSYTVTAVGPATLSVTVSAAEAVLSFNSDEPAGEYSVTVTAKGGEQTLPSAQSAASALVRLATPVLLQVERSPTACGVMWNTVAGAEAYFLLLTTPDGKSVTETIAAADTRYQRYGKSLNLEAEGDAWTVALQALPADDADRVVGSPLSAPATALIALPGGPVRMVRDRKKEGDPAACGREVITAFPPLLPYGLAKAMDVSAYRTDDIRTALRAAFPSIASEQLNEIIRRLAPPTYDPFDLIENCRALGMSAADCGRQMILLHADYYFGALILAMFMAGYGQDEARKGVQAAFPTITEAEMASAIAQVYPKADSDHSGS
ncbi:hypothetical protein VY88_20480 [Azospirillum thiophilum]|uniref:Fibronectin type-III domain-containing protein n=1 Tax=Azospirillum thiophilum TaxID=528244 RepID=A0AAC8W3K1_9PROT|nr:hypothetical protein [Azospirillum thiophilum]ALG74311.1 hypothetical protein AL072_25490 [Azospirillum thiophilum]KJR63821.1 hypothetical protein VY88_20480 [Azospirillum thiophilum]